MVKNIRDFGFGDEAFYQPEFEDMGGILYFAADDGLHGRELWRSDGTEEGTFLVKNIMPDRPPCEHPAHGCGFRWIDIASEVDNLTKLGDMILFTASDGQQGRELWRTDGTENGTVLVKDISPGAGNAFVPLDDRRYDMEFTEFRGEIFFAADDGVHGRELWKTDGTTDGTTMVKDFRRNGVANIQALRVEDDRLLFEASDGQSRRTWTTDGTDSGTLPIGLSFPSPPALPARRVVAELGRYYLIDGTRKELLAGKDLIGGAPSKIEIVDEKVIVFGSGFLLYTIDLNTSTVEANGPYVATSTDQWTKTFATSFVDWSPDQHSRGRVLTSQFGTTNTPVAPLNHGDAITIGFPAPLVDAPGDDLVLRLGQVWSDSAVKVSVMNTSGEFLEVVVPNVKGELIELGIDLAELAGQELSGVVRVIGDTFSDVNLHSVQATINSSVVLSASATNNPDLEFSWDLNQDGVYGDRVGSAINLTQAELATWGLTEPGDYTVSVRMNDRVNDYFDTTILTIPGTPSLRADLDGDGLVAFSDFLILSASFGKEDATRDDGDLDGDGMVAFADFLILKSQLA